MCSEERGSSPSDYSTRARWRMECSGALGADEQIFRSVLVMTTKKPRKRKLVIKGTDLRLASRFSRILFLAQNPFWRGQVKVKSLTPPGPCSTYWTTRPWAEEHVDDRRAPELPRIEIQRPALVDFIRGPTRHWRGIQTPWFLARNDLLPLSEKRSRLAGHDSPPANVKLDPTLPAERLATSWRLWVPANWMKEQTGD